MLRPQHGTWISRFDEMWMNHELKVTRDIKDREHRQESYNIRMISSPQEENGEVVIKNNNNNLINFLEIMISHRYAQNKWRNYCKMPGSYLWMCWNVRLSLKQKKITKQIVKVIYAVNVYISNKSWKGRRKHEEVILVCWILHLL